MPMPVYRESGMRHDICGVHALGTNPRRQTAADGIMHLQTVVR